MQNLTDSDSQAARRESTELQFLFVANPSQNIREHGVGMICGMLLLVLLDMSFIHAMTLKVDETPKIRGVNSHLTDLNSGIVHEEFGRVCARSFTTFRHKNVSGATSE